MHFTQAVAVVALLAPWRVSAAAQPSFEVLEQSMRDQRTLNGWDVLVSYDRKTLEKLVSQEISQSDHILVLPPFNTTEQDPFDDTVTANWTVNVQFQSPQLNLAKGNGTVELSFQLRGSFVRQVEGQSAVSSSQPIPSGLRLNVTSDIYSTNGEYSHKTFKEQKNATRSTAGHTVVLDNVTSNSTNVVCLSFDSRAARVVGQNASKTQRKGFQDLILSQLNQHFKNRVFEYCFLGLQDVVRPTPGTKLIPEAFALSNTEDSFHIWIAVKDGPHDGQYPTSADDLVFSPKNLPMNPIPGNYTSSIIFSHDLLTDMYFAPGLSKTSGQVTEHYRSGTGGFDFTGKYKSGTASIPRTSAPSHFSFQWYWVISEEVRLDMSSGDWTMVTDSGVTSPNKAASWQFRSSRIEIPWQSWIRTREPRPSEIRQGGDKGIAAGTYTLNAKGGWRVDHGTLSFSVASSSTGSWTAEYTCVKWRSYTAGRSSCWVPAGLTVPNQTPESMNIALPQLDHSLLHNLLFPGKFKFKAGNELAQPFDLVIAGHVGDFEE